MNYSSNKIFKSFIKLLGFINIPSIYNFFLGTNKLTRISNNSGEGTIYYKCFSKVSTKNYFISPNYSFKLSNSKFKFSLSLSIST